MFINKQVPFLLVRALCKQPVSDTASMKVLNMAYLCQWDNPVEPQGTCNVTASAMCLSALGVVGSKGVKNLPEELRHWIEDVQGGDRHDNVWLKKAIEWKGLKDDFRDNWKLSELITALGQAKPVVLDTWLSRSGHYIALKGYDEANKQFIVNDSNGEWFSTGYDENASGESLRYSLNLILKVGLGAEGPVDPANFPKDPLNTPSFCAHVVSK